MTAFQCVMQIYRQNGIWGFYKGISASYVGVSETVIHFVIYESIKSRILANNMRMAYKERTSDDFIRFMGAAAASKTIATTIAYPHGTHIVSLTFAVSCLAWLMVPTLAKVMGSISVPPLVCQIPRISLDELDCLARFHHLKSLTFCRTERRA